MVEWKDTSSWSQRDSDEAKAVPKTWSATIGKFRISVSRHVHYPPDVWVAHCRPDVFSEVQLASKNIDEAKCQAVAMLQVVCEDALRAIVGYDLVVLARDVAVSADSELSAIRHGRPPSSGAELEAIYYPIRKAYEGK